MTTYLLKVLLCSGLLWLGYVLCLARTKTFGFNRGYLLLLFPLSFLVPLLRMPGFTNPAPLTKTVTTVIEQLPLMPAEDTLPLAAPAATATPVSLALLGYAFVTGLLLIRLVRNLFLLWQKARRYPSRKEGPATLVFINEGEAPHSFLHWVFISPSDADKPEILQHEITHVAQRHSIDLLFTELVLALGWFNPFFYVARKALRLTHEYLADAAVLKTVDIRRYQHRLLDAASGPVALTLASSLTYQLIKKRMAMMHKTTSPLAAALQTLAATLLLFATAAVVSQRTNAQQRTDANEPTNAQHTNGATEPAKDTIKLPARLSQTIEPSKEGVSDALLQEYRAIIDRYRKDETTLGAKFWSMPEPDQSRLAVIFSQMSREQQQQQTIIFLKPLKPLPKVVPTTEQMEKFKNASVYGVWIDEKRVPNETLNRYVAADFSQAFISKLHGAAKTGRRYTHQLDLMTNAYYADYVRDVEKDKRPRMLYYNPKGRPAIRN